MTWLEFLKSLSPADLSLLNAGNGEARYRQILELDTRRLRRLDRRFQNRAQKTVTQIRAISGGLLTL